MDADLLDDDPDGAGIFEAITTGHAMARPSTRRH